MLLSCRGVAINPAISGLSRMGESAPPTRPVEGDYGQNVFPASEPGSPLLFKKWKIGQKVAVRQN